MSQQHSQFISTVRKHLSQGVDASIPRHVLVFEGNDSWHIDIISEILHGHEQDSLWVTNHSMPDIFPSSMIKNAFHWLGGEKQVVIFDARENFDVDAFAAISGIVVGGGFLILLLAEEDKQNKVYCSRFGQRLMQSISDTDEIIILKQKDSKSNFSFPDLTRSVPQNKIPFRCKAPFVTIDQQNVVETIESKILSTDNNAVVLISDRGRGKSAALGFVAVALVQAGIKHIAITAPRLRATDILFKHISNSFPDAVNKRGKIEVDGSVIQFYSPDGLIQNKLSADILLVDEAAAIPIPLLSSFLDNFLQCVFATTVHGYEGTGRGFSLRFNKILNKKNPRWVKLTMKTPIRWPEEDILEKWMFKLLCLDAEIVSSDILQKISNHNFEHQLLTKEQLVNDTVLLNEVFALLVLAHYRTRPNDLKKLLDDDDLSVYVTLQNNHVIAVALIICEGNFSESLSTLVYQGERRPSGHLLAQALTYHCGVEHAATLNYARVMRIAVHPELQQQGLGISLLEFIINNEKKNGRDAIGASFGMNERLLNFWQKLIFNIVRIGFTREQTSGEHAAIMLLPLTDEGETVNSEAINRFQGNSPYLFDDVLKDIPLEIKNKLTFDTDNSKKYTALDEKDLRSFNLYSRNYELSIAAVNKLFLAKVDEMQKDSFPQKYQNILEMKVINKADWKEIAKKLNLSGQNEARKIFHQAVNFLL